MNKNENNVVRINASWFWCHSTRFNELFLVSTLSRSFHELSNSQRKEEK